MGDLRHELARGRDAFVVDHAGLRGRFSSAETPITRRRSRYAKDLGEGITLLTKDAHLSSREISIVILIFVLTVCF